MSKKKRRQTQKKQCDSSTQIFAGRLQSIVTRFATWKMAPVFFALLYFVVAAVLGLLLHKMPGFDSESDFFYEYLPLAKQYLAGHFPIGSFRGPMYPLVLGAVGWVLGDFVKAGILISAASGAMIIGLSFGLLRRVCHAKVALLAVLFTACNAVFFMFSYKVGTDMIFTAFAFGSLFLLLGQSVLNWRKLVGAAILAGFAYLTRYNGIFLLALVPLLVWRNPWHLEWKRRWLTGLAFFTVFMVTIAPWGVYCLQVKGRFFYSLNYRNVALEVFENGNWTAPDAVRNRWLGKENNLHSLWDVVRINPSEFARRAIINTWNHLRFNITRLTGWWIGILAVLGVIFLWRSRPDPRLQVLILSGVAFLGVLSLIHYEARYSLFLIPLYALLAAVTLRGDGWPEMAGKLKWVMPWLVFATLAVSLVGTWGQNSKVIRGGPQEVLAVAQWFRANIPSDQRGEIVAARKPHIAYYMGLKFCGLPPDQNIEEFIAALRRQHVDYLYFGGAEAYTRRGLVQLIDPRSMIPHLKMLAYSDDPLSVLWQVD